MAKRLRTQSEIQKHGVIKTNVPNLLKEAGVNAMDLARYGMAINTAYRYGRGDMESAVTFETIARMCAFFSERLNRKVDVGDLFFHDAEPVVE